MATMKSSNTNGASSGAKKLIFSHVKYENLLAGISGGVASTLLLHPLDLIKIRFAVNDGRTAAVPQYRGLTSAFVTIFRQEGVKGLYKGVTPNVWGSGSAWGLYFMFYTSIKTWVQEGNTTLALGPAMHMLAAAEAGICTLVLTNPIWVVKTRLCLQLNNDALPGDNRSYKGMIDGLTKIYKTEGVRGLYRGFVPGMFGVSHGAVQFMVYEEMKNHYNQYRKLPIDTKMKKLWLYLTFPIEKRQLIIARSVHVARVFAFDAQQKPVLPKSDAKVIFVTKNTDRRLMRVRMLQHTDASRTHEIDINSTKTMTIKDFKSFTELQDICKRCEEFYKEKSNPTENEARLLAAFQHTHALIEDVLPLYREIEGFAHEYDYDADHPGNGFRSFLYVVDRWADHASKVILYIDANKSSIGFPIKRYQYLKELEACNDVLVNLSNCLRHLITLRGWTDAGDLFPNSKHTAKELLMKAHQIDQDPFYGRCLGFQYCKSIKPILHFISTSMAGFSKAFYYDGNIISKTTVSFFNSGKYYFDSEARARRIVLLSQNAGIDFCKSFWFLAENRFMYTLPVIAGTRVKINRVFQIPPEPLTVASAKGKGELIDIPVPSSHIGPGPVKARLISYVERVGMIGEQGNSIKNKFTSPLPPSDTIILHCHGGGFIACSSQSHEVYLREWTKELNVPIISIDYSLAPRAPFPRALEEIFYAYCWVLRNASLLGTTAQKIILAGDSAGANLNLGIALKCIQMGIRKPDGIFMAYCPTVVDFVPSPARLLCLMDPLLPFGFMMQCLKAYSSPSLKIIHENKKKVEHANNIKYAGREALTNNNDTRDVQLNGDEDDEFVQEIKRKFATTDIVVHEHEEALKFNETEENVVVEEGKEMCEETLNLRRKLGQIRTSITSKMNQITHHNNKTPTKSRPKKILQDLDSFMEKSASEEFSFEVPNDPNLSPYHASDVELAEMPPICVVSTNLDPCLDDCIMYAKRLKAVNNDITLDVLSGLPHGFLNFTLLSKEAHEGNKICIKRIKELIDKK